MDKLIIKKLDINDKKEIEQVSEILYNWWGKEEGFPKRVVKELVESRCMNTVIPIVFIAILDDEVIGTISLIANDVDFKQDLYPMISSFFVEKDYRGMGIGKDLMENLISHCKDKFSSIYLATDLDEVYEKFGFEYIETCKCYYNLKQDRIFYSKIYRKKLK